MVLYLILPGPKCLVALIFWVVEPISCPSPRKQVLAYQNPMAPRHHSIIVQFRLKWLKGMEPNHVSNWRPITFPILWKVRGFEDSQKKIERVTCPRRWRQSWAALPVGISAFWYGGNPQRWWLFFPGKSWKKMFHCQGESPEGQCPETTTTTTTTTTTIQQFNSPVGQAYVSVFQPNKVPLKSWLKAFSNDPYGSPTWLTPRCVMPEGRPEPCLTVRLRGIIVHSDDDVDDAGG